MTDNATRGQLQANKLWDRVVYAKKVLEPRQTEYRVVYEDPREEENVAHVLVPDPHWMAMALRGDIVPPISAYLELPLLQRYQRNGVLAEVEVVGKDAAQKKFDMRLGGWTYLGEKVLPTHELHTAPTLPAMTEEQAIEYLLMKDVPSTVWQDKATNRRRFIICSVRSVPQDRSLRNAWRVAQ